MNAENFVFKIKRDTIPEPEDFSLRKFSCFDFFTSTNSFIEHNFRGAVNIDFPETCKGFVHISPRGFAYFISILLSEIYGNSMVNAQVTSSDTDVIITIKGVAAQKRIRQLENIAERSGFSVIKSGNDLILKTPVSITQEMFVYARDILELINYFYEVFLA